MILRGKTIPTRASQYKGSKKTYRDERKSMYSNKLSVAVAIVSER